MVDKRKIVLNNLISQYGFQEWWEDTNRVKDWVSMILIQRTTEKNAKRALANLDGYLSVDVLVEMDLDLLRELIKPAGFYQQKSCAIKELMQWYQKNGERILNFEKYSTSTLREQLLAIKGIGPETADVMLLYIFERKVFIADQYAMRLFNRLGWGPYSDYETMRLDFKELVEDTSYVLCREWHAAIDTHGKAFGKNSSMDESFLVKGYPDG